MTFSESVKRCLGPQYLFKFRGRASRREFWFFALFNFLVNLACGIIFPIFPAQVAGSLNLVVSLLLFPANLGVAVRRLHDRNLSGWWLLLPTFSFAPLAMSALSESQSGSGLALALFFAIGIGYVITLCLPSQPWPNKYGEPPAAI